MIHFYTGGAGGGKSFELMKKIENLSDKGKKICVIVPEQYSYEFEKKLYNFLEASKFNNLRTFSFKTLSDYIIKKYGDNRRLSEYANENKRAIIMYLAMNSVYSSLPENTGFYERQYKKTGFAGIMADFINEIQRQGISPDELDKIKNGFSGRLYEKMKDISAIYREYCRLMSEFGFRDIRNDVTEAADIANNKEYFKGRTVIIDEFDGFTGDQYKMLKVIIENAEDVYISLRTDNINAPEFTLFDIVNDTYRQIKNISQGYQKSEICSCDKSYRFQNNQDLIFLSKNIFKNNSDICDSSADNIKIFEAKDFYSEIEYVCAEIKHILYENHDISYNDIAIISNDIESYAPIIQNAGIRFDIPFFMSIEKDISHSVFMIYICSLIDIISSDNYNTETIFKYLKTGMAGIDLIEISKLENFCYEWKIKSNKWKESFIPENATVNNDFTECEEIRKKIINPLEKLKSEINKEGVNAENICRSFYSFIKNTGADLRVKEIISIYNEKNETYIAGEYKRIWNFIIDIIDDLYSVLGTREISVKQFGILFKQLMSQAKYSLAPETLDRVTVASATNARLNSPKIVFIIGANENIFPLFSSNDRLFSSDEREKLSEKGFNQNKTSVNSISNARLTAYKALSSASEKLYISYSLTSLNGEALYKSAVINDITGMFSDGENIIKHETEISEDYYAVTPQSAYYHLMQSKNNKNPEINAIRKVLEEDENFRIRIQNMEKNKNAKGKNYELSDKKILEKLVNFHNFNVSSTKLDTYNKCHFRYFCQYCLGLKPRQTTEMNFMNWGNLRHECFCQLFSSKNPTFEMMSREQIREIIEKAIEKFRQELFKNNFIDDSRTNFLLKKNAEHFEIIALYLQEELKNTKFSPAALEAVLAENQGCLPPLKLAGKNGNIIFGGKVDRIDTYKPFGDDSPEKYIRIIDYKTKTKGFDSISIGNGINMQMLLYMAALTANGTFRDFIPAGLFYVPLTLEYNNKDKNDVKSYISKNLRFRGISRNDDKIIEALDNTNKFIHTKFDAYERKLPVLLFSEENLDIILDFAEDKLKEMNESLYNGDIRIDPLINNTTKGCDYCGFSDICGNYPVFVSHDGKDFVPDDIQKIFEESESIKKDDKSKSKKEK